MKMDGSFTLVLATLVFMIACEGRGPTTPTPSTPVPSNPQPPSPTPPPAIRLEMTGMVTDEEGAPISGATVSAMVDPYTGPFAVTDGSGRYSLQFVSTRGANAGPPGTESAVAMALVEAAGYEFYTRYVIAPTEEVKENFRLLRVRRITAGQSATVTVTPEARVCGGDWSPGRETICAAIRIVSATNGILTVRALPSDGGSALASLTVSSSKGGGMGNPVSIPVFGGTENEAILALPWGLTASRSFVVETSISVR